VKSKLDQAHEAAEKLTVDSTPDEVHAVLNKFKEAVWPVGKFDKGTVAWLMADFFPEWIRGLK
jgi:hypothetical protein